jgi:ligand-binding sensor domain-containing protein
MRKFYFFALALMLSGAVLAQTPAWTIYGSVPISATKGSAMDDSSNVWIATFGGGVSKMKDGSYTTYTTSNSGLPNNTTKCVAIDNANTKWIGTQSGLAKFDGTNWTVYTAPVSLPGNNINCITIDNSNTKWIGIQLNGLTKYDGSTFQTWKTSNSSIPNNNVNCVAIDNAGNKWVGTYAGLAKFDGTTWTTYSQGGGAVDQVYSVVFEDATHMWVGTGGGLFKFDGSTWTPYTIPLLPSAYVNTVAIDAAGNIWAGTTNGGIAVYDGVSSWTYYDGTNTSGLGMAINNIMIDPYDNKWVCTNDAGLAFYGIPIITATEELNTEDLVSVYPNPFNVAATIELTTAGPSEISLFDIFGNEVRRYSLQKNDKKIIINKDNLVNGVYLYRVISADGISSGKIIVN